MPIRTRTRLTGDTTPNHPNRRSNHARQSAKPRLDLERLEDRTLMAAGDRDSSFGGIGLVFLDPPPGGINERVADVAVRNDGVIVVAETSNAFTGADDIRIVGLNSSGAIVGTGATSAFFLRAAALALQPDGKSIIIGSNTTNSQIVVVRFNTDFTLDTSFDGDGVAFANVGGAQFPIHFPSDVAVQPDGKIVVVGSAGTQFSPQNVVFAIARFNTDGSLDPDFNGTGVGLYDFTLGFDNAEAVAIQPDGKIVVAGRTASNGFTVLRLNPDGTNDTSFASVGFVGLTPSFEAFARDVSIQNDGKIVVSGGNTNTYALARLNSDGSLDKSFSFDGIVHTVIGGANIGKHILQSNGDIVVAGSTEFNCPSVARYLATDGSLDPSFGRFGRLGECFLGSSQEIAIQADGKLVVAGHFGGSIVIARLLGNAPDIFATGTDAGIAPKVRVFDAVTGVELRSFSAYAELAAFTGGVRVAVADVNGDGVQDIITAPGAGNGLGAKIKVFDGNSAANPPALLPAPLGSFVAYGTGTSFVGGVFVAAGDVNGDGRADIITGIGAALPAGQTGQVRVFSGASAGATPTVLHNINAFAATYAGGVRVAVGDITGDRRADIIVAPGGNSAPRVRTFDGVTGRQLRRPLGSFMAFEASLNGGLFVAAADVNGDRLADIIVGAGTGSSRVRVFSGRDRSLLANFMSLDPAFNTGVRVGAVDANGDGREDIIVGAAPGKGSLVAIIDGATLLPAVTPAEIDSFLNEEDNLTRGVFVAGGPRLPR